jgi:hypothetical protein
MPERIGPKRLLRLLEQGIDLYTLPPQQFEAFRAMARLLTQPPGCTPKRLRPKCGARCRNGRRCQALDVCFISTLPVMQRPVCKVWADKRPVQSAWGVR